MADEFDADGRSLPSRDDIDTGPAEVLADLDGILERLDGLADVIQQEIFNEGGEGTDHDPTQAP